MDLREVCDFFVGTFFYDDYRGNLTTIHVDLERQQQRISSESTDEAAALLLLRGLWNLLSGDLKKPSEYLISLIDETKYECRWASRSHVYLALLRLWRIHPPILPMCDLEGPTMAIYALSHWDEGPLSALSFSIKYFERMSSLDKLEFQLVKELTRTYEITQRAARRLNTDFAEYAEDGSAVDVERLQDGIRRLILVGEMASDLSLPAISAYISRLIYWLSHLSGEQRAHETLETMQKTYADADDDVGLGLYWLTRGDHNISPPFTCPTLLNFEIADSIDEFGGISKMFTASHSYQLDVNKSLNNIKASLGRSSQPDYCSNEISNDKPVLYDPHLARQCYDKAEMHFSKADAKRGLAMLALRKACLMIMKGLQLANRRSGTHKDSEANKLLANAQKLCDVSGDYQLAKLTSIHQALLNSGAIESRDSLHAIARSVEYTSNEVLGLQLALLSLRKGLYLRYFLGCRTQSINSLEVCRQMVKVMRNFKTLWYQVMLTEISSFKSGGDLSACTIWTGHLKDHFGSLASQCLCPIEDTSRSGVQQVMSGLIVLYYFSQAVATAAVSIALQAANKPEPLDEPIQEFLDFLPESDPKNTLDAWRSHF